MSVSPSIPTTIEVRRSHLLGLITAVAALAAGITFALLAFAVDTGTERAQQSAPTSKAALSSLSPETRQYVESIMALTPKQLAAGAAGFGTGVSTREAVLSSLSPETRQYVESIMALTPKQLAASFGTEGVDPLPVYSFYSNPKSRADVLSSLSPETRQYVESIMALTPKQLAAGAAGFGTGK